MSLDAPHWLDLLGQPLPPPGAIAGIKDRADRLAGEWKRRDAAAAVLGWSFLCRRPRVPTVRDHTGKVWEPERCWRCEGCRSLTASAVINRAMIDAAYAEASYLVTLTAPAGTADGVVLAEFEHWRKSVWRDLAGDGGRMGFMRSNERHKSGTLHIHLIATVEGDYDPLALREHWPWLSDIRLLLGRGCDLDGHIGASGSPAQRAGQRQRWTQELRELHDPHVQWEVRTANAVPDTPAIAAIAYPAKYLRKAGLPGEPTRSYDTSAGFGAAWKAVAVVAGVSPAHARAAVERANAVHGPTGWHLCQFGLHGRPAFKRDVIRAVTVASGLDDRPDSVNHPGNEPVRVMFQEMCDAV